MSSQRFKHWVHGSAFAVLMAVAVGTLGLQMAFAGKVAPNTMMMNSLIEFEDGTTVQEDLSRQLDAFEDTQATLIYEDIEYAFAWTDLGLKIDKTATVQGIPVISASHSPWAFEGGLLGEKEVGVYFKWDGGKLLETLNNVIPELESAPIEPQLQWNSRARAFETIAGQDGWMIDREALTTAFNEQVQTLTPAPTTLTTVMKKPALTTSALEAAKPRLQSKLTQPITLTAEGDSWTLDWRDHLDWLTFMPQKTVMVEGVAIPIMEENTPEHLATQVTINIELNGDAVSTYVTDELASDLEVAAEDVIISQDDNGDIAFEGTATDGIEVSAERLTRLLEMALNKDITDVEIPLVKTLAQVTVDEELYERGITELVSTGYSGYWGSPYNRQHNIRVAIGRYDGVMVEPGETFSFGEILGEVDGSTGYAKELVIKEGETIPEYGGGICQVSSTLFRAILFGGLPIVERYPHSYAVSYYSYPLGYGLDATVYPPQVDLKFLNDMDTPLLIQAYQEGQEAYFKFYGTKDGREVALDGPYISDRRSAPPPIITETTELAPGVREKVDSAHNGFTATWTRHTIYPDGRNEEDIIVSPYTAWAEKWLVGVDKNE